MSQLRWDMEEGESLLKRQLKRTKNKTVQYRTSRPDHFIKGTTRENYAACEENHVKSLNVMLQKEQEPWLYNCRWVVVYISSRTFN